MNSVRKLVIIPVEDWARMTKENEDGMLTCPREIDCGTTPSGDTSSPPPLPLNREEEKKEEDEGVGGASSSSPPLPSPPRGDPQGQEGKGEGERENTEQPLSDETKKNKKKRRWGPPGRPVKRSKKWIDL